MRKGRSPSKYSSGRSRSQRSELSISKSSPSHDNSEMLATAESHQRKASQSRIGVVKPGHLKSVVCRRPGSPKTVPPTVFERAPVAMSQTRPNPRPHRLWGWHEHDWIVGCIIQGVGLTAFQSVVDHGRTGKLIQPTDRPLHRDLFHFHDHILL